jgi:hypothetical protein
MITDLPETLMSALSQGLSQFGINLPPMPTSLLTGPGSSTPATMTPGLGMAPMTPGLGVPPAATPGLGAAPLTTPGVGLPSVPATLPPDALTNPALTPAITSPTGIPPLGTVPAAPGGLTTPPAVTDPSALPIANPGTLSEMPISAPIGLDPLAGTYPVDPSLAAMPASTGSGGLLGEVASAADTLGAGEAMDLLKGMLLPAIMSAIKPAGTTVADAAATAAPITQAVGQVAPAAPAIPPIPGT